MPTDRTTTRRISGLRLALCALAFASAPAAAKPQGLRIADTSFEKRHYAQAAEYYRAFIARNADHPAVERAALRLAESVYETSGHAALRLFERCVRDYGYADRKGRGRFGLALCLLARGELRRAERVLRELLAQSADAGSDVPPRARLRLAWILYVRGRRKAAERAFNSLAAIFAGTPLAPRARLGSAACRLAAGDADAALRLFGSLAESGAPPSLQRRARLGQGMAAMRAGKSGPAAEALRPLAAAFPSSVAPAALFAFCSLAADRGSPSEALKVLDTWMAKRGPRRPDLTAALLLVGKALAKQNAPPSPEAGAYWTALGLYEAARKRWRPALAYLTVAGELGPRGPWTAWSFYAAGVCAERLGRFQEAAGRYAAGGQFVKDRGLSAELLLGRIRCAARHAETDQRALNEMTERLLNSDPGADAALQVAEIEVVHGSPARAEQRLTDLLAGLPDENLLHARAALWRGRALRRLGRYPEAAADFGAWLASNPKDPLAPSVRAELADALLLAGEMRKALNALAEPWFRQATPAARARRLLVVGRVAENRRRFKRALAEYDSGLRLSDNTDLRAELTFRRAACLYALGREEASAAALASLLKNRRSGIPPTTLAWAAATAARLRLPDQARCFADALLRQANASGVPQTLIEQAAYLNVRGLASKGLWKECAEDAEQALKRFPESRFRSAVALDRGEALLRSARPAQAREAVTSERLQNTLRGGRIVAESLSALERPQQAVRAWKRIIILHGADLRGDADFLVNAGLGRDLEAVGRNREAREAYARALRATPETAPVEALQIELRERLPQATN